jgi:hypothetical protein
MLDFNKTCASIAADLQVNEIYVCLGVFFLEAYKMQTAVAQGSGLQESTTDFFLKVSYNSLLNMKKEETQMFKYVYNM